MIQHHRLSAPEFDAIAGGYGDLVVTRLLQRTQLSRTMLLLCHIATRRPDLVRAAEVLAAAQAKDYEAAAAVLGYPWVSAWVAKCAAAPESRLANRFDAIAFAAALRAGIDSAGYSSLEDRAVVPTIGEGRFLTDGAFCVETPVRSVAVGVGVGTMLVDDVDPFRGSGGYPVASRLSDAQWQSWQGKLTGAWSLLAEHCPSRYAELAGGLVSIVPLEDGAYRAGTSVTHSAAFGGLACTTPRDPAELAVIMVHEYQHSKLNALMCMIQLCDADDAAVMNVPWRPDPRPMAGVLHGVYAFTAVADLWRALREDAALEQVAQGQFTKTLAGVTSVIERLAGHPGLTPSGHRFVSVLGRTIAALEVTV